MDARRDRWNQARQLSFDDLPQRRKVSLQIEADFKHAVDKVGLRFYVVENGRRTLASLAGLFSLGRDISERAERNPREWPEPDRQFLNWLMPTIRKINYRNWNLTMLVLSAQDFQRWRQQWRTTPGRFIDRESQRPLPAPGQTIPVEQFAQLSDEGDWVKVSVGFRYPDGSRRLAHEIYRQLSDDPNAGFTRREMLKYEPPVSWGILSQFFSRKSPRMPRDKVVTHLAQLLDGRLDIIEEGPCVRTHFVTPKEVTLNCYEEEGLFHLACQCDGHFAPLGAGSLVTAQSRITEIDRVFHIELHHGGELGDKLQLALAVLLGKGWRIVGQEAVAEATEEHAADLREFWLGLPEGIHRSAARALAGLLDPEMGCLQAGIGVRDDHGLVAMSLDWQIGGEAISEGALNKFLHHGLSVLHHGNGWFALDSRQVAGFMDEMRRAHSPIGSTKTMSRREARSRLLAMKDDRRFGVIPADRSFTHRLVTEPQPELPPVPAQLSGILRSYQREGFDFLNDRLACGLGAILADDMGLGKTLQVLAVLLSWRHRWQEATRFRALVVCPATVIPVWMEQGGRFTPELKIRALSGSPERRRETLAEDDYDVLVTHYGLLRVEQPALAAIPFAFAVLDEAQNIKNPLAAVTQAAHSLQAEHRLALTGTPLENRPLDIWSIMDFLNPGFLGESQRFIQIYETGGALNRLHDRLKPLVIRRTKRAVAPELPPRFVDVVYCELQPGQRRLYDSLLSDVRSRDMSGSVEILAALTRLRQACCDPELVLKEKDDEMGSGKLEFLLEKLGDLHEAGHSVIVFSVFATMLDIIAARLAERKLPFRIITGATPLDRRASIVQEFNDSDQPEVFLLSLKAAGTGLNLTKADYVFNYDPWWNPAAESQAIDRTHRIGQTRPVTAYKLIARDTIEERVLALMDAKQAVFDQVVGSPDVEDAIPSRLTREYLLKLLR